MNLDEADAGHAREVSVEGPNRCVLVGRDGGDQEVRETETLAGGPCALEPVVNPDPRLLVGKKSGSADRERRNCTTSRFESPTRILMRTGAESATSSE